MVEGEGVRFKEGGQDILSSERCRERETHEESYHREDPYEEGGDPGTVIEAAGPVEVDGDEYDEGDDEEDGGEEGEECLGGGDSSIGRASSISIGSSIT